LPSQGEKNGTALLQIVTYRGLLLSGQPELDGHHALEPFC
jgi:hypothetical protein